MEIYEGKEPYIFVSYSHKDSKFVYPLLQELERRGYRIWFDKGIVPGTNWTDYIAEHIAKSHVVLAIISDHSLKSEDCRRELDFAISERKKMVPVVINDAKLSAGMKMQISSIQSVYCKEKEIVQAMDKALFVVEAFEKCKGEEVEEIIEEKIDDKKGIRKKKKIFLSLFIIIILTFVGIGGFSLWKQENKKVENVTTNTHENMYHVTLTSSSRMTVKEFNNSVDIIKERIKKFAGENNYTIDLKENKIEVYINKDVFGDKDIEYIFNVYIARALKLCLINEDKEYIEIDRESIESIKKKNGSIPGIDAKKYDIDTEKYPYLEITLTDQFIEDNYDEIKKWDEKKVYLAQDYLSKPSSFYYSPIYISVSGKKVKVLLTDLDDKYLELAKFNWLQEPLDNNFDIQVDFDNLVQWDSIDKNNKDNQINASDFKEKTIVIIYKTLEENISEGNWTDIKKSFKKRLDTIGEPYAIGDYTGKDSKYSYLAVKTTLNRMGIPVMDMVGKKKPFYLQRSLSKFDVYKSEYDKNELKVEGNKLILQLDKDYKLNRLEDLLKLKGNNEVLLNVEDIPILAANMDDVTDEGKIEFSDVVLPKQETINDKNNWLLHLIETIWNDTALPFDFDIDSYSFSEDSKGEVGNEDDFEMNISVQKQKVINRIKNEVKDAEVVVKPNSSVSVSSFIVNVYLDLEVNETLPKEVLNVMEKIYTVSNFEECLFNEMNIYLITEKNNDGERARIYFHKFYSYDGTSGKISVSGIFRGGRLEKYRDSFESLLAKNKFIKRFQDGKMDLYNWVYGN